MKTSFAFNRTFSATIPFGAVALISLVSSSGCKFVGTDYEAPQVAVPDAWNQRIIGSPVGVLAVDYWWKQFEDESMNQLIDAAIESNKSLAIAYERVLQARSARQISNSALFPQLMGLAVLAVSARVKMSACLRLQAEVIRTPSIPWALI